MKKLCVLTASAAVALGVGSLVGSLAANAGVVPGIGEATKTAVEENTSGVVDLVRWRRHHHHRRGFIVIVPRYHSYRHYRRW